MKIRVLVFCIMAFVTASAQKKGTPAVTYYAYDRQWNNTDLENAVYLALVKKLDDTAYQWSIYNFKGPLLSVETYKDKEQKIPHGYFAWFDKNGLIDSSGFCFNGKRHHSWLYFSDLLSVWQTEKYQEGVLLERKDSLELNEQTRKNDSIGFLPGDKEAVFRNGDRDWAAYLQSKLRVPERAESLNIQGIVKVYFMVDTDGSLKNIRVWKSVEYSLDEEAYSLIQRSPPWHPAVQLERKVQAYRLQPFTFIY